MELILTCLISEEFRRQQIRTAWDNEKWQQFQYLLTVTIAI